MYRFADDDDNASVADHYSGSSFQENKDETLRFLGIRLSLPMEKERNIASVYHVPQI